MFERAVSGTDRAAAAIGEFADERLLAVLARQLFDERVVAFGSLTAAMQGLDDLVGRQWAEIWPTIRDFAFDHERLTVYGEAAAPLAVIAALWRSLGRLPDGAWYERAGRSTLVLERREASLVCIHSHFSMNPGVPPKAA